MTKITNILLPITVILALSLLWVWAFPKAELIVTKDGDMCSKPAFSFEYSTCYQPNAIITTECEVTPLTK